MLEHLRALPFLVIILAATLLFSSIAFAQTGTMLSPLKQYKSGIPIQEIKCKTGYALVIRSSNGYPSCVKPTSEQRLLAHGWIIPKFEAMQVNHDETANTTTTTAMHRNVTLSLNDASRTTANTIEQENRTMLNGTSNATVTNNLVIGIINPKASSNHSDSIKIISIGMSPNPLKVGDKPEFTLTYQNISNRTLSKSWGCTITPLGLTISPPDNVLVSIASGERGPQCVDKNGPIHPNQVTGDVAGPDPTYGHLQTMYPLFSHGFYQIMKPGILHVTMELFLQDEQGKPYLTETVQFDVNATR